MRGVTFNGQLYTTDLTLGSLFTIHTDIKGRLVVNASDGTAVGITGQLTANGLTAGQSRYATMNYAPGVTLNAFVAPRTGDLRYFSAMHLGGAITAGTLTFNVYKATTSLGLSLVFSSSTPSFQEMYISAGAQPVSGGNLLKVQVVTSATFAYSGTCNVVAVLGVL
jgi:hypothetical protein